MKKIAIHSDQSKVGLNVGTNVGTINLARLDVFRIRIESDQSASVTTNSETIHDLNNIDRLISTANSAAKFVSTGLHHAAHI
jgi:hypothetical protein